MPVPVRALIFAAIATTARVTAAGTTSALSPGKDDASQDVTEAGLRSWLRRKHVHNPHRHNPHRHNPHRHSPHSHSPDPAGGVDIGEYPKRKGGSWDPDACMCSNAIMSKDRQDRKPSRTRTKTEGQTMVDFGIDLNSDRQYVCQDYKPRTRSTAQDVMNPYSYNQYAKITLHNCPDNQKCLSEFGIGPDSVFFYYPKRQKEETPEMRRMDPMRRMHGGGGDDGGPLKRSGCWDA